MLHALHVQSATLEKWSREKTQELMTERHKQNANMFCISSNNYEIHFKVVLNQQLRYGGVTYPAEYSASGHWAILLIHLKQIQVPFQSMNHLSEVGRGCFEEDIWEFEGRMGINMIIFHWHIDSMKFSMIKKNLKACHIVNPIHLR